jgi:uncharacterized metal-binding protein YceD (DUF177 family)
MTIEAEFHRPVRLDTLGPAPHAIAIEAEEGERAALARRFRLPAIHVLSAEAAVSRSGETIIAEGRMKARVTQSCVASGAPVEAELDEPFRIEFRPHPEAGSPDEEFELGEAEMDVVFYDKAMIDLGEAVAETLSLSLDPWPRAPGAEEVLKEAGVKEEGEAKEGEAGPFAALAGLRDKLGK